ncbi:MAG: hypothetical protein ACPGSC_13445 [Granulosicoccaceae bacterium]
MVNESAGVAALLSDAVGRAASASGYSGLFELASVLLGFLELLPIYWVQRTANKANGDPFGTANQEYSWRNLIFIVTGLVDWAGVRLGFYLLIMGSSTL